MKKNFSVSLLLGDSRRLREMSAMLSVTQSSIVSAAYVLALCLMEAGEYIPLGARDYLGPANAVYTGAETIQKLKRLCLVSDLTYSDSCGRTRRITSGKVVRDVLHCMLDLHEAGVQLNLEAGNGK